MRSRYASMNRLAFCLVFAIAIPALAKDKSASKPPPATIAPVVEDKKVDISDLESKYWAPKDTDFSVVQNRTYSKEKHFFIAPQYGVVVNDRFNEGNAYGVTGNYFWKERYGVQATYIKADLKLNKDMRDLANQYGSGVQPDHGRIDSYYGVGFNWVPFYAKMSVLSKQIIYFDMAFSPTVGITNYKQSIITGDKSQSAFTYGIDVTQYFFFSRWVAIRADLKNNWHQEKIAKYYATGGGTGAPVKTTQVHDSLFLMGLVFFW